MEFDEVGSAIEGARNQPNFESGFGDDSGLDDFSFDSLPEFGSDGSSGDSGLGDGFNFGGENSGGFDGLSGGFNGSSGGFDFNNGSALSGFGDGGFNSGGQVAQKKSWEDHLSEAFTSSLKSSWHVIKSLVSSVRNRVADDWALFANNLLIYSGVISGVSLAIWIISILIRMPIKFGGLPLNSLLSSGLGAGSSIMILSGIASLITRTNDNRSRISPSTLQDNENDVETDSLFGGFDESSYESDEDFDDSIDSILSSIYSDDDDTNSDSDDNYGDDSDSYGSNSSNDDIFSRMMNNYDGGSNSNDISDSVPSDVPIITREFLVNLFKGRLLSKTPTFSKVEGIEAGEDRFKDAETLIISAYAAAAGKEVDEIANKVYLDSMKENLFSYDFMVKRPNSVRITEDKLREELEAFFKSDKIDDNNPDAGLVNATVTKERDKYRIIVTKPNMKEIVGLGDCIQKSDVESFFKNEKNALPVVVGITERGVPILRDFKVFNSYMIAGKQRSGKSWYVASTVMQLQMFNTPEDVQFLYIDPKESYMFKSLSLMPHCCGLHNHLHILDIMDAVINSEAPRRKKLLRDNQCETIWALREKGIKLPILYIVIDEYMTIDSYLQKNVSMLKDQMNTIMSQFPSIGIRLMFIPHRAQGVVDKTARTLIDLAAAVKTEQSIVEETIDTKKWTTKLTMPGDIALRMGSDIMYVRGPVLETSDEDTIKFVKQIAKSFYKMGVDLPDMSSLGIAYNRNESKIRDELQLDGDSSSRIQYDANALNNELDNL